MEINPALVTDIMFVLCAVTTVACAFLVVYLKNPIYCSIFLVASFIPLAAIYLLLYAPFIAAIQIMVYAGAIMVLFTFVIMMIGIGNEEYKVGKGKGFQFVSVIVVLGMFVVMIPLVQLVLPKQVKEPANLKISSVEGLKMVSSKELIKEIDSGLKKHGSVSAIEKQDKKLFDKIMKSGEEYFGSTKAIGVMIFGQPDIDNPEKAKENTINSMQIISFELASILIMVAIVGAVVLASRRREDT